MLGLHMRCDSCPGITHLVCRRISPPQIPDLIFYGSVKMPEYPLHMSSFIIHCFQILLNGQWTILSITLYLRSLSLSLFIAHLMHRLPSRYHANPDRQMSWWTSSAITCCRFRWSHPWSNFPLLPQTTSAPSFIFLFWSTFKSSLSSTHTKH